MQAASVGPSEAVAGAAPRIAGPALEQALERHLAEVGEPTPTSMLVTSRGRPGRRRASWRRKQAACWAGSRRLAAAGFRGSRLAVTSTDQISRESPVSLEDRQKLMRVLPPRLEGAGVWLVVP